MSEEKKEKRRKGCLFWLALGIGIPVLLIMIYRIIVMVWLGSLFF